MKQKAEKIRDDLYVKKGKFGYTVVYPVKNEDGSFNGKMFKKALFSDIISSLPYLLAVGALLFMLLPGANQLKEQCEEAVLECQENACDICYLQEENQQYGGFNVSIGNVGVDSDEKT